MRALPLLVLLAACGDGGGSPADLGAGPDLAIAGPLVAWFDLPRQRETEALSAAYFDGTTLYALKDDAPEIVPFTPSAGYASWTVGTPIPLARPGSAWDGEGLGRAADGSWYVVAVETAPVLERYDPTGAFQATVDVPARFQMQSPGNMGIESLSLSPSGASLFFANEGALTTDGPIATKANGTRIRIHRRPLAGGADDERAYLTEPCGDGSGGTLGVSEVTALSDDRVLVLERGYQAGYGNTVRIYSADLATGADVSGVAALDASTKPVTKQLVLDLATLPADGIPVGETQPNPILDNYEALALGPKLADGRQIVFVVSDDNARASQVARVLVLALTL